jgi:hypothetical protein
LAGALVAGAFVEGVALVDASLVLGVLESLHPTRKLAKAIVSIRRYFFIGNLKERPPCHPRPAAVIYVARRR